MYQEIITARETPVVTVNQLCTFARVDVPTSDDVTAMYALFIESATDTVESIAARACLNEQILETYDYFPGQQDPRNYLYSELNYAFTATPYWWYGFPTKDSIELVRRPVSNTLPVTVTYNDPDGVQQTLDPASYKVFADKITLNVGYQWPVTDRRQDCIQISYWAGYSESDPTQVPPKLQMAVLYLAAHYIDVRNIVAVEPTSEIAFTLNRALQSFKSHRIPR